MQVKRVQGNLFAEVAALGRISRLDEAEGVINCKGFGAFELLEGERVRAEEDVFEGDRVRAEENIFEGDGVRAEEEFEGFGLRAEMLGKGSGAPTDTTWL